MRRTLVLLAGPVSLVVTACDYGGESPDVTSPKHVIRSSPRIVSPIESENRNPGSDGWVLAKPALAQEVEGYASRISVPAGDPIDLMVNVDRSHGVRLELYRVGYYAGHGGRLMATDGEVRVDPQPACPVDATTGLVECHWATTFHVVTNPHWISGHYLAKLIRDDGFDVYVPFVVREREPNAPGLVQASVTTWQAYNVWGGTSLYHNLIPKPRAYDAGRAYRVSFDRPIEPSTLMPDTGEGPKEVGATLFLKYEHPLVSYLERRGYDIAYTTNVDVTADPSTLLNRRIFFSIGHDEYWPVPERDAVEAARDGGVSLAFLSANTGYWRVRLDPSSSGVPNRIVTCYKGAPSDPERGTREETVRFRDGPYARPENALLGVMYELYTRVDGFPLIVTEPDSWVFSGTGLRAGDSLGNLVGYEWDHVFDNGQEPAGLQVIGASPAFGAYGTAAPSNMTVYEPTAESFVFAAGTMDFSWGEGRPGYVNGRAEEIVNNLMVHAGVPANDSPAPDPANVVEAPGSARSVLGVAGSGEEGFSDGSAATAQFDTPAGVAAGPDGTLYVTESRNHRIRAVSPDGVVTTLAGCGPNGVTNGKYKNDTGTKACFDSPTGMAMGPDGALYVADSGNSVVRRVTLEGVTSTYAGGSAGNSDGPLRSARFQNPEGVAFGSDGTLYVADSGNDCVRSATAAGVKTIATGMKWPTGITVGNDGTIYVAATAEGRLYAISGGVATPIADVSATDGDLDGPARSALLRPASGLALVGRRLVFSDTANNTVRVLDLDTMTISRLAGTGHFGSALGSGAVAEITLPRGLTVQGGRIVAADSGNHRILSIDPGPAL